MTSNLGCQIDSWLFESEAQSNFPDENGNMSSAYGERRRDMDDQITWKDMYYRICL